MRHLTIREIIEGSYKEGFNLSWRLVKAFNTVIIEKSGLNRGGWKNYFTSIDLYIRNELAKYHPYLQVLWV